MKSTEAPHPDLVLKDLMEKAAEKFGTGRAAELQGDLEQLSAEVLAISTFELELDDEP